MDYEPKEPYVYQPYGTLTHPEHNEKGMIYGVGGVGMLTEIKGVTKEEAEAIAEILKETRS